MIAPVRQKFLEPDNRSRLSRLGQRVLQAESYIAAEGFDPQRSILRPVRRRPPRGGGGVRNYEAAQTNRHTENHFLYATNLDADSLIRASLQTIRNRARYEVRNNSYAEGIIDTFSNYVVGTGPHLQYIDEVEDKFAEWGEKSDIRGQLSFEEGLKLDIRGCLEAGEALVMPVTDERAGRNEIKMKLLRLEADRMETPWGMENEKLHDGVEVDKWGRPIKYHLLKQHPGGSLNWAGAMDYQEITAEEMIHLYRMKRPEQTRGIPWITPSLLLFAQLRRFVLAVLDAAETAADFAGAMKTQSSETDPDHEYAAGDFFELERRMLAVLPQGYDVMQFKPEQPATTFKEFKAEILNEIARCINMPYNIAAAKSDDYNYASGRLDHQSFFKAITIVENWQVKREINPILYLYLKEAVGIPGYFTRQTVKQVMPLISGEYRRYQTPAGTTIIRPQWMWDGYEHVDPVKEAVAQNWKLKNLTTHLPNEYAKEGKDWRRELKKIAEVREAMFEEGLLTSVALDGETDKTAGAKKSWWEKLKGKVA